MKKGKYEIHWDGSRKEIDATEFAIFGYGSLIVHRDVQYPTLWSVSEPRTGLMARSRFKTRKQAMEEATAAVIRLGESEWDRLIQQSLRIHSTRYQKENYE